MARKINTCGHPDRKYKARGRCNICYKKWKLSLEDTPTHICIDCGKEYKVGKGSADRCHTHYLLNKRRTDLEYFIREKAWGISKRVNYKKDKTYYGLSFCGVEAFMEFSIKDSELKRLWVDWSTHGYDLKNAPSIDRIDVNLGYDIGNLQWLTYSLNTKKDSQVPVEAYKDGEFIGRYDSGSDAAKELGVQAANLYKVLNGHRKATQGYIFKRVANE